MLNEIDRERLIRLIDFLEGELKDNSKFTGLDQHTYERDSDIRRNLERWAENIVNSSIDLAKIILASEKKVIPQTYREILQALALITDFPGAIAEELAHFAKLRNILAHEYLDLRFKQLKRFVERADVIYKGLLDFAKNFITEKK